MIELEPIEKYADPVVVEQVGDYTYTSSKFPALRQLKLLARLVRVLGDRGIQGLVLLGLPQRPLAASGRIAGAAVHVAQGLLEDQNLVTDLLQRTKVNAYKGGGGAGDVIKMFDTHFQGEVPHLVDVVIFVIKHNFMGFTQGPHSQSGSPTGSETTTDAK